MSVQGTIEYWIAPRVHILTRLMGHGRQSQGSQTTVLLGTCLAAY